MKLLRHFLVVVACCWSIGVCLGDVSTAQILVFDANKVIPGTNQKQVCTKSHHIQKFNSDQVLFVIVNYSFTKHIHPIDIHSNIKLH